MSKKSQLTLAKIEYIKYYLDTIIERFRGFDTKAAEILGFIIVAESIVAALTQMATLLAGARIFLVLASLLFFVAAILCVSVLWPKPLAYPGPDVNEIVTALEDLDLQGLTNQLFSWLNEAAKNNDPRVSQKARLFKTTCLVTLLGILFLLFSIIVICAETFKF